MLIEFRGTPLRTSSAATVSARRIDRRWLYCGVPEVSVYPFTSMRVYCTRVEFSAASRMIWRARSVSVALSQSKNTRYDRAGAGAGATTGAGGGGGGAALKAYRTPSRKV